MSILEELLAPRTFSEFERETFQQCPFAEPAKARQFAKFLDWALLWEIFASHHSNCWLVRNGHLSKSSSEQSGHLSFEQAKEGYARGETILVRHSEKAHPKLARIAQDFADFFQAPIDIQLYITPEGEQGFDWHYDLEEVFVIQSSGEKEFYLRPNTLDAYPLPKVLPKDLHFEKEKTRTEIRCLLKAGDWLYIPSGWWHKAKALGPSFHLSVGVLKPVPGAETVIKQS